MTEERKEQESTEQSAEAETEAKETATASEAQEEDTAEAKVEAADESESADESEVAEAKDQDADEASASSEERAEEAEEAEEAVEAAATEEEAEEEAETGGPDDVDPPKADPPKKEPAGGGYIEQFEYDDAVVRKFVSATVLWGVVGMLVGLLIAIQMFAPYFNFKISWLTFGRLRPLHTNAVIFAFAGNAIFAGVYYSTQRLLKARMYSDRLSSLHFWGWQGIIVAAAITLPLGFTQGKEYAELEWPIDIAITVVWVIFALNFFGTIIKRRERHLYVAIWFYIATIVTVAILHIFNNLWVIAGGFKSYPIYAGVQDAFMQWWYGHNAVAFFLTTPFLGLMYYFLPKAAERPVYSYRLSIIHFWSLIFIYIWAGPHHLHYTALPAWASTLGMLFSVMLWMPSWGGMINGLFTLRGAWHKLRHEPVLPFMVAAVTFYGMSTFEGPLLSIKSVNALSHYTDWTIAHVHSGALGWNGFLTFGMVYWLAPRLFQSKKIWSKKLVWVHFFLGTFGILIYVISMYIAGVTQGMMWRDINGNTGLLKHPDFILTVVQLLGFYKARAIGGALYLAGTLVFAFNIFMTWRARPKEYAREIHEAAPLFAQPFKATTPPPTTADTAGLGKAWASFRSMHWHRAWERLPMKFTVLVIVAVVVASLFEIIPTFVIRSNVPTISSVKPYTPLELYGRDIYIREGCYNCHSQMVRPIRSETERYGPYSKPGEFVYDHPFQWGSRRIGPDLHRVGGKWHDSWHYRHMRNPREIIRQSTMPAYPWLLRDNIDKAQIQRSIVAMIRLGVPYSKDHLLNAKKLADEQAQEIAVRLYNKLEELRIKKVKKGKKVVRVKQTLAQVTKKLKNKEIVALIAYLQRLGTDIKGTKSASK